MPGCDQITIGALYDCQNPPTGGARPRVILVNRDDLGSVTANANDIITAIALNANAAAYVFEGYRGSVGFSEELVQPSAGQALFRHKVMMSIFDFSQVQKTNIQRLCNGRVLAFIERTQKGANSFMLAGLGSGLIVAPGELSNTKTDAGTYKITLQSPEGEEEAKLAQNILVTDYATTLTTLNGLTFAPTISSLNVTTIASAGGTDVTATGTNFFGGVGVNQVVSVTWVNQLTGARVNQTGLTVANTTVSFTSVAVTAAQSWKLEILTTRGVVLSTAIVTS